MPEPCSKLAFTPALLLALTIAGCGRTVPEGFQWTDYQAAPRQTLQVEMRTEDHTVYLDHRTLQASPLERQRLSAFLADLAGNRPEALRIELKGGSEASLKRVEALLLAAGIESGRIKLTAAQTVAAPAGSDAVVVAAERAIALVPQCPGWVDHPSAPGDNAVQPNFGCSDTSNLAAMIADPRDLKTGQSNAQSDGEVAATAVGNYRAGKVKDLPKTQDQFSTLK